MRDLIPKIKIPIYQVDAFARKQFAGNPAAVCVLDYWLDDKTLQAIAAENNLAETAFFTANNRRPGDRFHPFRACTTVGRAVG